MLKYCFIHVFILAILLGSPYIVFAHNQEIEAESFNPIIESPLPEASNVIKKMLDMLPIEPISGSGTIKIYEGDNKQSIKFEFKIKLKGMDRTCSYSLLDAFGDVQEKIIVVWTNNNEKKIFVQNGKSASFVKKANSKDLAIGKTDLKVDDLTLECLHWQNWKAIRRAELLGRKCVVLQNVRDGILYELCIDDSWLVPLQWQEFLLENKSLVRTISVKSFKKINDVWMVKDIEIYNHTTFRKTIVIFDELSTE